MPNFLVQIPENKRIRDVDTLIVFAADAADARIAAEAHFDGDAAPMWATVATVTELVVGAELADAGDGWSMYARISGAAGQTVGFDPFIVEVDGLDANQAEGRLGTPRKHLDGALNDGGTATYIVDDILTAVGGTFTRAATFRVTSVDTGVIDGLELVDPGEYTELPAIMTANPVTGGGGTVALVDLTQFAEGSYEALLAQMVTGLLGSPDIEDTTLDLSEGGIGTRLLTVSGTTNDDLGDGTLEFEVRQNGTVDANLVSTITDGGVADAVLSVAVAAIPIVPARVIALKT